MIQVNVWPRLVADLRDIELEGPGNEDLSNSSSIIEAVKEFQKIESQTMEYVLCPYFLP